MHKTDMLAIGDLAARAGLSVSAIRFYEARGLVSALRNAGGQRRFMRSDIRRLSFIRIAQQLGFTIEEIGALLGSLPLGRTPTQKDWAKISRVFRRRLDERIAAMTHMREKLDECIGCGCLSLRRCALYNPQDRLGRQGAGPQLLKVWDVSA
jgi:MerR family redox-sensitive transcriptional activator SoxR